MSAPFKVWSVAHYFDWYNHKEVSWFRTEEEARLRAGQIYGDLAELEDFDASKWNGEEYFCEHESVTKGPWLVEHEIPDTQATIVEFLNEHAGGDEV